MNVPLLDLRLQYLSIKEEIDKALSEVLEDCGFILGERVKELEARISAYCGVKHGIAVASGTDALFLSLKACGVGPGDEVITSTYSFFSSAGTIWNAGGRPVFVDIDPDTFNLDVSQVKGRISDKTKAVMPVHLFGQCAEMVPLLELASEAGLPIIEDAAQAIGATSDGRKAGSLGLLGCFSFYPSKNLGAYGDAGMIVTNDSSVADKLRLLRVHGAKPKYFHRVVGVNSRLDALQAAVLLVKLKYLDSWSARRRNNAGLYDRLLQDTEVVTPKVRKGNVSIYNQYVVRVRARDAVKEFLAKKGIGTDIYYPLPLHLQECFRALGYRKGELPRSEKAAQESLALPIYPELTPEQQEYVVSSIREALDLVSP
ncbi:MAG: DegT/DnrJ/EryC1/StrS family aminotransferase [Candidatus Eiseniibacteriota bacterium]|nr:MAG: DegT/DnrJ/EryC1/StrS family aminotransferase [Candidatus Eisenbacteria bacterium]